MTENQTEEVEAVLEFVGATVRERGRRRIEIGDVKLRVEPGELVMVRVERTAACPALADTAEGLQSVEPGEVRFEGQTWNQRDPRWAADRRGRIGRVFEDWGWISNLNVMENVLLAAEHHGHADRRTLSEKAEQLARRVGLSGVPPGRPAFVSPADLRRAQWVRALLRDPVLLLLERPMKGVPQSSLQPLCDVVDEARQRGAAVIWLTSLDAAWRRWSDTQRTRRFEIRDNRLVLQPSQVG